MSNLVEEHLPDTFYKDLPDDKRLEMLVEIWNRCVKSNQELQDQLDKAVELLKRSRDNMLRLSASHSHLSYVKQINEIDKFLEEVDYEQK